MHAGVVGYWNDTPTNNIAVDNWQGVRYNPYLFASFVTTDRLVPIFSAKHAIFTEDRQVYVAR